MAISLGLSAGWKSKVLRKALPAVLENLAAGRAPGADRDACDDNAASASDAAERSGD